MSDARRVDDEPDGGLQVERTTFAWWRTTLAMAVVSLLLIRQARGGPERWITVAITAAALAVVWAIGSWRTRALARQVVGRPGFAVGLTGAVVVLQVVAVLLVL